MIDYGVEEIMLEDEEINMFAPFDCYGAIQKELENKKIQIISSEFDRIPQIFKELDLEKSEVNLLIKLKKTMMSMQFTTI